MNEWLEAEDSISSPDDVAAACHLDGPLAPEEGKHYICTLDLGVKNDRTAAVIAHAERGEEGTRVIVDRMKVWIPRPLRPVSLDDVRSWLVEMCKSYRATLHYDPSQAYLLVEQLRKAGLQTREFTFTSSSVGRLATALMQALRSRLLSLPNDEDLRKELLSVHLRESSPNVLKIDTRGSGHDDQAVVCGMAVYLLTSSSPSAAAEWLESLAPIGPCGHPSMRGSVLCEWCGIPLPPVVQEAQPAPVTGPRTAQVQPPGWQWAPIPDRMPTPETANALRMLEHAKQYGNLPQQFNRF
jgi:hypothetical protein